MQMPAIAGVCDPGVGFAYPLILEATMTDSPADRCVFRKDGEYWTVVYGGQTIRLRDAKGLQTLAELLRNPGREFHATDLMAFGGPELGSAGAPLDARAKLEYQRRLTDLREELAEAERFGDGGRASRAREEIEALAEQLAAGVGLGGRDRPVASHAERARVAVTQRLKTTIAKIRESQPSLARHLAASVKTGAFCSYDPEPRVTWDASPAAIEAPDASSVAPTDVRRLAAIMFTDVAGYTALMGADEAKAIAVLERSRELAKRSIEEFHGQVIEHTGDGTLASFPSAVDAVHCARAMQRSLADDSDLRLRIGIHVGDVLFTATGVVGDGVNVASRIHALAEPGGVCVSEPVYDAIRNRPEIQATPLGEKSLRNVNRPIVVYVLNGGGTPPGGRIGAEPVRLRRFALIVALLALVGGAAFVARRIVFSVPDQPSLAILPFVNLSGDPEQDHFASGMTEDLITDASKLSRLFVIAHDSVLPYRGKPVRAQDVGRELGIRYVLEGSLRRAGDEMRVSARLVDATDGRELWSERYDRKVEETFAIHDEILGEVVRDLQVEITEAELLRIRRIPTKSLTAYESYMRAIDLIEREPGRGRAARVQALLERAIELDPSFADAHAALSIHLLDPMWLDQRSLPRTRELAERALALNESLPLAHVAAAFQRLMAARADEAVAEVDRAVVLGPNDAAVHAFAATIYNEAGRGHEAMPLIEKATRLNPRHPPWYSWVLGRSLAMTERYEEAIAALKNVARAHPDFLQPRIELAAAYRKLGREQEAKFEESEIRRLGGFTEEIVEDAAPSPDALSPSPDAFRMR